MASVNDGNHNLQPQTTTESIGSACHPFKSGPEIEGENTFDFEIGNDILLCANKLALEAKNLIKLCRDTYQSQISDQFKIELRETHHQQDQRSKYKMVLRIDSIMWFDDQAKTSQDLNQLYDAAVKYVDQVKSEIDQFPEIFDAKDLKRVPIDGSMGEWCSIEKGGQICPNKGNSQRPCRSLHHEWCLAETTGVPLECIDKEQQHFKAYWHTLKITTHDKPAYQCRYGFLKLDRTYALCLFQVDPNFWIYHDKVQQPSLYPYFIVSARKDATPTITLNPVKHCQNEEYVQSADAWQAVLQTLVFIKSELQLDKCVMKRIYVNFGKWVTQRSDPMNRDYHAHINIELTRQTIEKITEINFPSATNRDSKKLFPSLAGSFIAPRAHRLDDARKLIQHAHQHMTPLIRAKNQELEHTIVALKRQVETLEFNIEKLTSLMTGQINIGQEVDGTTGGESASEINASGDVDDVMESIASEE